MAVERAQAGWTLWLQWVLANTVGFLLGFQLFAIFWPYAFFVLFAVAYALMGVMIGVLQWLVLRRQVPGAGRWVWATIGGFALGGTVGMAATFTVVGLFDLYFSLGEPLSSFLFAAVLFAPIGPVVGIAQWWLVLRRQIEGAGWWVLACTVALALFGAAFGAFIAIEIGNVYVGAYVVSAVGGLLAGAITGVTLVWLLRQRVPER